VKTGAELELLVAGWDAHARAARRFGGGAYAEALEVCARQLRARREAERSVEILGALAAGWKGEVERRRERDREDSYAAGLEGCAEELLEEGWWAER
jgi:hypothetical protein